MVSEEIIDAIELTTCTGMVFRKYLGSRPGDLLAPLSPSLTLPVDGEGEGAYKGRFFWT
jgi:hypothetical protein